MRTADRLRPLDRVQQTVEGNSGTKVRQRPPKGTFSSQTTSPPEALMDPSAPKLSVTAIVVFEFSLGALALVFGWLLGFDPLRSIVRGREHFLHNLQLIALGGALAVPLLAFFLALDRIGTPWSQSLREVIFRQLLPAVADIGWSGRAVVALAAGIGEELLFRGLIQGGLETKMSPAAALITASVLFGLGHIVNAAYFAFATAIGLVLGLLLLWTGSLVTPIATHAVYDFLALEYLVRQYDARRRRSPTASADEFRQPGQGP